MRFIRNSLYVKIVAILLSLFFLQNDLLIHAQDGKYDKEVEFVKNEYISGNYILLIEKLEKLLNKVGKEYRKVSGEFFLLLGAAYEHTGKREKAIENYLLGDLLLDSPVVEGIDLKSLKIFQETILGKTINGRRVIEKVGKRKIKKKISYLAILSGVVFVVAAYFLMKKKSDPKAESMTERYANEVFNSIEWIYIPEGEFQMGDNYGMGSDDEVPVHRVYLHSYKISKLEITYDQYDKYTEATLIWPLPYDHEREIGVRKTLPARKFTFLDAGYFCEWLTNQTGKKIRIPTEAQWEKAARGTTQSIYPWGNSIPDCNRTNINNCIGLTQPVGSYPSDISVYGVMDMGGNVAEFVSDAYQSNYYSISPLYNPKGPSYNLTHYRVVRGGNWSSNDPRATNRSSIHSIKKSETIGLRIVWID